MATALGSATSQPSTSLDQFRQGQDKIQPGQELAAHKAHGKGKGKGKGQVAEDDGIDPLTGLPKDQADQVQQIASTAGSTIGPQPAGLPALFTDNYARKT